MKSLSSAGGRMAAAAVCVAAAITCGARGGDCPGNTNIDNAVNVADLTNVILAWGTNGQGAGFDADLNNDGTTNVQDLTLVITNWGNCPPGGYACNAVPPSPANDCCSAPTLVAGLTMIGQTVSMPFDNTMAETDGPDDPANPCESASDDSQVWKDLWYRYNAAIDALLIISNCGAADFDSKIVAYAIPGGTLDCNAVAENLVACNEDCVPGTDSASELSIAVTAGQSYLIRLGSFSITALEQDAESGSGTLSFILRPKNDLCEFATPVGPPGNGQGAPSTVTQNLCPATDEVGLPDCDLGVPDDLALWFTTIGNGTTYTVNTCMSPAFQDYNTRLSIICASDGATACDKPFCDETIFFTAMDDTCGPEFLNEEREFCTQAGRAYLILVHSAFGCGNFTLQVTSDGVPCGSPTCDPPLGRCCFVKGACTDGLINFDCTTQGGVWAAGEVCADECPTGGCCLGENPCQDGITEADCLAINGVFVDAGTCDSLPCPTNDVCEQAMNLGSGNASVPWDNTLATAGTDGAPFVTCDKFGDTPGIRKDLWYVWTAAADGMVRFDTCGGGLDTKMAVYVDEGCPVAPVSDAGCNDDDGNHDVPLCGPMCTGCGTNSSVQLSVTQNTTYRIRVGSWGTDGNEGPEGASVVNVTVLGP